VYRERGAVAAVLTIGRDRLALEVEAAIEQRNSAKLDELVA
jgi:hypothetical protein